MKTYAFIIRIILLLLLFIFSCGCYHGRKNTHTVKTDNRFNNKFETNVIVKDGDLLNQYNFNLDKMNPNRWNYGNEDFAPYIDGSYKQVTNNYVPNFKFNNYSNTDFYQFEQPAINDVKVNNWKNKSNNQSFLVQCK
jgi:hypothetical protein